MAFKFLLFALNGCLEILWCVVWGRGVMVVAELDFIVD